MDNNHIKCFECRKICEKSKMFTKGVHNLKLFPNELRTQHFCSIACIDKYVKDNEKPEIKTKEAHIYNWSGGQTGY